MPNNAQENILITPNGQACLGEFGITGTFLHFDSRDHKLGIIRYIAPECDPLGFQAPKRSNPSEESDVYSLALTSLSKYVAFPVRLLSHLLFTLIWSFHTPLIFCIVPSFLSSVLP